MDWSLPNMDWLLFNMDWSPLDHVGVVGTFISVGVFLLSSYKTSRNIRTARKLTRHLYLVRSNLRRSMENLRQEHAALRGEVKNLDKKMAQSIKTRNEIDRTITHMTKLRGQLQQEMIRAGSACMSAQQTNHGKTSKPYSNNVNNKNLPVFVRRPVEKSSHSIL